MYAEPGMKRHTVMRGNSWKYWIKSRYDNILTWANQVRILKQSFQQLAGIVGGTLINAFKPLIQALNSVMGKVIAFAETVTNALGSIFGWQFESGGTGGIADDFSGMAGDSGDIADNLDNAAGGAGGTADNLGDAAKNIEKMNKGIRKFDELINITMPETNEDSGNGGGGGGKKPSGGGSGTGSGAEGAKGSLVKTDTIFDKYKSDIDSLYELGKYIGDALSKAMESIDWDSVYEKARNFGKGLAEFLNGLISPRLFGNIGKTIAGSLNTALHFLDSFGETFDWKNFGKSIAAGINGFFKKFDFKLLGHTFNVWAKGLLDTMIEAVSGTRWDLIGRKIGEFFAEIDWKGILSRVGRLIWEAINAAISVFTGMFSVAPIETTIIAALAAIKITASTIVFFENLIKKVTELKIAFSNLTTFLGGLSATAGVVGAFTTAIGLLAAGFYSLEKNWNKKLADEFADWEIEIGSNADDLIKATQALEELSSAQSEFITAAQSEVAEIDALETAYFQLADQTTLTSTEQARLRDMAGELVDKIPLLSDVIDTQTGKYRGQKEEIEKLIEAKKEAMLQDAYADAIKEERKAWADANIELTKAQSNIKTVTDRKKELEKASRLFNESTRDENVILQENKAYLESLGINAENGRQAQQILAQETANCEKELEKYGTAIDDANEAIEGAESNIQLMNQAMDESKQKELEATQSSAVFQQALSDLKSGFEQAGIAITEDFAKNLTHANYDTSGLKDFMESLKSGSQADASQIQGLFESMSMEIPTSIIRNISSLEPSVQAQVVSMLVGMQSGVSMKKPELEQLFSSLGIDLPQGLINNLSGKGGDIQSRTIELLQKISDGEKLLEPSLKELFSNLGVDIPDSLTQELSFKKVDVQKKAIELISELGNGADFSSEAVKQRFKEIGVSLPEGIQEGVDSYDVEGIGTKMGQLLETAVRAVTETHSPSAVFARIGQDLVAGLKQGIETFWENLSSSFLTLIGNLTTNTQSKMDNLKTIMSGKWTNIKTDASQKWSEIKTTISSKWDEIKSKSSSAVTNIYTKINSGFSNALSTVRQKFDAIKNKIHSVMDNAASKVKSAIEKIKSAFNFSWSLPPLKLPHIDITGGFSLNPPSVPQFSLIWKKRGGFLPSSFGLIGAGENGVPEVLGSVGGKPAIAGGVEITGIRDAVYETANQEVALLKEQNRLLQAILEKEYGITKDDIGRAAQSYSRDYMRRTGRPAYDF